MSIDITATVPRLEKTASLQGIRKISSGGAVTYDSLQLSGDPSVRHEIIARYLAAEQNLGHEHDLQLLALTAANYKFRYRTCETLEGRQAYVFKVSPRHKREGSFDGDLWIDAESFLPLRESGKIVQHSIFLRRLTMVRKFRIMDRMAVPISTDLNIDTRLVGKAQMTVKLHDVSLATQTGNLLAPIAVQ